MKTLLALATFLTLAACGADGDPTPPTAKAAVSISGDVQVGVSG